MRVYIIPSSLFVPGRIMEPLWIDRDIEELKAINAGREAELAALPGRIAATASDIAEKQVRLSEFDKWRVR